MSITGKALSSQQAYASGQYSSQGYVDYDPSKDPGAHNRPRTAGPPQPGAPGGTVQYRNFPGGRNQNGVFANRQTKPGLGYQTENPDQNLKRDRITPKFNNYARQTMAPNMGFVGPQDPTQQQPRRQPHHQPKHYNATNNYKAPSAIEATKKHFSGGY